MGRLLDVILFFFALWALSLGAFVIGLPLLGYLFYKALNWGRGSAHQPHPSGRPGVSWRMYAGIFLLLLSVMALFSGGVMSPIMFALGGVLLLSRPRLATGRLPASPKHVEGSVILRDRLAPFLWYAVMELKLSTQDVVRVLCSIGQRFIFRLDGGPPLIVLSTSSLSRRGAERKLLSRAREISMVLAPLGAFLLPLDCFHFPLLGCSRVKLELRDPLKAVATAPFDMLVVQPEGQTVAALGAYQMGRGRPDGPIDARQTLKEPLTLWELANVLVSRSRTPGLDWESLFFGRFASTRGLAMGERLIAIGEPTGRSLLVSCAGSPPLELTRAQLRFLMCVYS
jgi:hypothetical protein